MSSHSLPLGVHMERDREISLSLPLLIRLPILTLMTSFNLNYLLKALAPNISHRGLGLQHMNLEEDIETPVQI